MCVLLFSNNHICLINKWTFTHHFLSAWAVMPRLSSVSLAPSPASVVLEWSRFQLLAVISAGHSEQSVSHWKRQKCSGAPANTLPPWPSVDGPFLLSLSLLFPPSSSTRVPRRLSEMSAQWRHAEMTWNLTAFCYNVYATFLVYSRATANTEKPIQNTLAWMPQLREMKGQQKALANLFFRSLHVFLFRPIKIKSSVQEGPVLNWVPGLKNGGKP